MKKLISMTDFVITQWSIDLTPTQREKIKNYANFLKQPLTLGMFIPTDENGNVLEEPNPEFFNFDVDAFNLANKQFQQAKDRVIFEGFEFNKSNTDGDFISNINISFWAWELKEKTIEDLVKYNLTIAETAVKKYGL